MSPLLPPLPYADWDLEGPAPVPPETPPELLNTGWGNEEWGEGPWGDGELNVITAFPIISSVVVVAQDLLQVNFSQAMKVNSLLQDPATYKITPFDPTLYQNVVVTNVQIGQNQVGVDYVLLAITDPTPGGVYDLTVVAGIVTLDNVLLTQPTARITYRRTKTDSLVTTRPSMYSSDPTGVLRNVLTAIGISDDIIGGSQFDGEVIFRNE